MLHELSAMLIEKSLDFRNLSPELIRLELDTRATSADVMVMRLEPTDRLTELLSAGWAGDIDRLLVEKAWHVRQANGG
jgi:hypothetical protein